MRSMLEDRWLDGIASTDGGVDGEPQLGVARQ